MPINPIILIIAGGILLMHFAQKTTSKQSVVNNPTGVIDTRTNHGTAYNYSTGKTPPMLADGYDNMPTYLTHAMAMNGVNPTTGQPYKGMQ